MRNVIIGSDGTKSLLETHGSTHILRREPNWNRGRVLSEIVKAGVPCFSGSCSEVYFEKAIQDAGMAMAERLPVARELGETSLMFLVHPTLTHDEITLTCRVIKQVLKEATA